MGYHRGVWELIIPSRTFISAREKGAGVQSDAPLTSPLQWVSALQDCCCAKQISSLFLETRQVLEILKMCVVIIVSF